MRDQLRDGTRDLHERVEAAVDLSAQCADLQRYRALLRALWGWWPSVEARLGPHDFAAAGLDFDIRRRATLLARDLAALRIDPGSIPAAPSIPTYPSLSAALGGLYVLEGATLGGAVIARRLASAHGLGPDAGAAFFGGRGGDTGSMWRGFVEALTRHGAGPSGEAERRTDEAVRAARATFESFEAWLAPAATKEAAG